MPYGGKGGSGYITGEGLQRIILTIIVALVISIVFLQLWSPAGGAVLRQNLYNLINDSNFTNTYGTGVRDALVYVLDLLPLLVFFGIWTIVGVVLLAQIRSGKV